MATYKKKHGRTDRISNRRKAHRTKSSRKAHRTKAHRSRMGGDGGLIPTPNLLLAAVDTPFNVYQ